MSLMTNAQNTLIQGATFNAIVHGDVHHHSGSQLSVIRRTQRGFEILQRHVAQAAFHDSLERSDPPRCHPLTRRAILHNIMNWISDSDNLELFIWIFGPAGGGKTAIAQTIAEMCAAAGSLAASFFFSRTVAGRKDFNQLVPTLAYQLSLHIPEIREDISLAIEHDPSVFSRALATQMQVLILQPLNAAANDPLKKETMEKRESVVVLDGFDECGDGRSQREVLEVLSAHVKLLEVRIIFLITSRPEQQIRVAFSKPELASQTLAIALDENLNPDDDIRVFLEEKFRELKMNHPSGPQLLDQWPSEDDIRKIVQKSSGQFIYAATVMKFMDCHRHPPVKRLKIILGAAAPSNKDSPFAELDALYQQLFLSIDDLEGAMDLLTLLVLQERDSYYLTVDFSENLLAYDQGDVLTMLSDMHAFVHVPKPGDLYDAIRIHHASLPDFLFDRSRSGRFFIDSRNGHANITTHWIKFVQRTPLPDLGARTVVRPRGHNSIIITVERIIEHCTQSHLTDELCKALLGFNLEAHLILYPGSAFKELIQSVSSFLQWLKPETPELNDARLELYRYHMTHIDHWILNQLSLFPDDMRSILSAAFIFEDKFSSSPGALFDILSHKFDPITNSFSKIEYLTANKDFWFICQEFGGALLFDIFNGFFMDASRSGTYVVHERGYAELACIFLDHIRLAPEGKDVAEAWSHHRYHYVPNGNRYRIDRTEGTDEVLIRAALEFLPKVLSRSPQHADLVQGLKDHALQLKSTDPLHEKRLEAAIAGFEYLKKVESTFEEHFHKPDYNVCIVCLLQPGAIPVPAPFSRSPLDQAVNPQREVEAVAQRVTFTGRLELRLRWIPPMRNDPELEETATTSWIFQSAADLQQMVEGADLPQMVEGADLPQMVEGADLLQVARRTTPVTLDELYSKWILPKREDSEINETAIPNAFPMGSPSRTVGPERAVEVAAEPITPKAHPRLILAMQDDSQLKVDETVTTNAFSAPSPPPDPQRVVEITAAPGALIELQLDEAVTPNGVSASSPILDPKGVVGIPAEPVIHTEPQFDETVTPNGFSTSSPSLDPQRVVEITAEPVALTKLQLDQVVTPNGFSTSSPILDPKGVVGIPAEPVIHTEPQFDETVAPNGFSTSSPLLAPKRVVEITAEPVTLTEPQLDETAISNGFSTPSLILARMEITVEPVALTELQLDEAATPNGFSTSSSLLDPKRVVEIIAEPAPLTELRLEETVTPNGFSTSSPLVNSKRVVEITAEPTTLTEPQPDELATPNTFSVSPPQLDSKRVMEITASPPWLSSWSSSLPSSFWGSSSPSSLPSSSWGSSPPWSSSLPWSSSPPLSSSKLRLSSSSVTLTEPQLDETAIPNAFSVSPSPVDPQRVVEITTEPVNLTELQLEETPTPNGFSTSSPLLAPKRVVETTAEPVTLTEPRLDETAIPNGLAVEATAEPVILTGQSELYSRWIPSMREDSELEETGTPSWMFQSGADLQQMVESADLPQTVEGADLQQTVEGANSPQVARRTTEPVTLTELHLKWILPKREDSGINETTTPNGFSTSSSLLDPKRVVEITAEPVALPEPQFDEPATPNVFSASSPLLNPRRVVEITVEPVTLTEPQLDEAPTLNGFSTPSPLLNPKRAVEITAEPVSLTEPQLEETASLNGFSTPSRLQAPKRVVETTAEPVTLTKPHPRLSPPTLEASELTVPDIRLVRTSTLLLGFVIVTITLATLHQNWARTSHL